MKKSIKYIMALSLAVCAMFTFAACGGTNFGAALAGEDRTSALEYLNTNSEMSWDATKTTMEMDMFGLMSIKQIMRSNADGSKIISDMTASMPGLGSGFQKEYYKDGIYYKNKDKVKSQSTQAPSDLTDDSFFEIDSIFEDLEGINFSVYRVAVNGGTAIKISIDMSELTESDVFDGLMFGDQVTGSVSAVYYFDAQNNLYKFETSMDMKMKIEGQTMKLTMNVCVEKLSAFPDNLFPSDLASYPAV